MATMTPQITQLLISLAAGVPVWGVMFYFFTRMIRSRDDTEKDIRRSISNIEINLNDLHTSLLLLKKDFEYARSITATIESLVNRVDKNSSDINEAFKRQRNGHV